MADAGGGSGPHSPPPPPSLPPSLSVFFHIQEVSIEVKEWEDKE